MSNIVSYEYPTSKTFKDLSGERFGRLHVDSFYGKDKNYNIYYNCTCDCGNKLVVSANCLKNGDTVSCGCYHKENQAKLRTKHGHTYDKLYWVHHSMKQRCYNKNNPEYHNYGGRGITICDEWLNKDTGFENFYNWAMKNGYAAGLSIDRINNNEGYNPNNCRWVDNIIQSSNRRQNRFLSIVLDFTNIGKGKVIYTYNIHHWSRITGIPPRTLKRRIYEYHWNVEEALTAVTNRHGRVIGYSPIKIPEYMIKYNQPEKFDQSVHD